jgi:hypothetical protein
VIESALFAVAWVAERPSTELAGGTKRASILSR